MQLSSGKVIFPSPLPPLKISPSLNKLPAFLHLRAWSPSESCARGLALWRFLTGSLTRSSVWVGRASITLLTSVSPQPTVVPGTQ